MLAYSAGYEIRGALSLQDQPVTKRTTGGWLVTYPKSISSLKFDRSSSIRVMQKTFLRRFPWCPVDMQNITTGPTMDVHWIRVRVRALWTVFVKVMMRHFFVVRSIVVDTSRPFAAGFHFGIMRMTTDIDGRESHCGQECHRLLQRRDFGVSIRGEGRKMECVRYVT